MIFNLNYGASLSALPARLHELQSIHIHLLAERPKTEPSASELIFERLKNSLIHQYYSKRECAADSLFLLAVQGATNFTSDQLSTELHLHYLSTVPIRFFLLIG